MATGTLSFQILCTLRYKFMAKYQAPLLLLYFFLCFLSSVVSNNVGKGTEEYSAPYSKKNFAKDEYDMKILLCAVLHVICTLEQGSPSRCLLG